MRRKIHQSARLAEPQSTTKGDEVEIWHALPNYAGLALELAGVAVIVVAAAHATGRAISRWLRRDDSTVVFESYRRQLGRGILLGLELLVAGDIIKTVAIEPTFESVGVLAVIVLIRTFLSFTLEVEMTGRWPWQGAPERE